MARIESLPLQQAEFIKAKETFTPEKFGFEKHRRGWKKNIQGVGSVIFMNLDSGHGQLPTPLLNNRDGNALELASQIHQKLFGTSELDTMSPSLLALAPKTGGSIIVAYREEDGFTPEGWLGIGIVFGGENNTQVSAFLGTREEYRDRNIGLNLRTIQAYDALTRGKTGMVWLQGARIPEIAMLSFGKLGAKGTTFAIDIYHNQSYRLFGTHATDRIAATWDLLSEDVQRAVVNEQNNIYTHRSSKGDDLIIAPIVELDNIEEVKNYMPVTVLYRLPSLIEQTEVDREAEEIRMRTILPELMDSVTTYVPSDAGHDPAFVETVRKEGSYIIDGVTMRNDADGSPTLYYVLRLKSSIRAVTHWL